MRFFLIVLLGAISCSYQKSTPEDAYYVGAVLEYNYDSNTSVNLKHYVDYVRQAAEQDADIVVFPEMTLTRSDVVRVPVHGVLKEYPIPALHPELYHDVLAQMSRAAREHGIYVLVNLQEEMDCGSSDSVGELCPAAVVYRFNTNVVFDRSGSVINRYRKINLFGEYSRTPSLDDQLGVFTTDFGVKFGHFICFDLMFQVPAIQLVHKLNVTDVLFSTMWFSEAPFLTAVEIQEAYAYANNVNFLAAGANRVTVGSAGSGIYSGRAGALISTMPGVDTRRLLVSRVPKTPGQVDGISYPGHIPNDPSEMDSLLLKRDQSIPSHVTRVISSTEELQEFTLTDGAVACSFRIRLKELNVTGEQPSYQYRGLVYDGTNTYASRTIGVSACAVIACRSDDVTTCGCRDSKITSKHSFSQLRITFHARKAKYNDTLKCMDASYNAVSFKTDKYPVNTSNFKYSVREGERRDEITLKLAREERDILTFGVWGRIYTRDVNRRHIASEQEMATFEDFENGVLS